MLKTELVELKSGAYLNIFNEDDVREAIVCDVASVRKRLTVSRILNSVKHKSSSSPDMSAIFHF